MAICETNDKQSNRKENSSEGTNYNMASLLYQVNALNTKPTISASNWNHWKT